MCLKYIFDQPTNSPWAYNENFRKRVNLKGKMLVPE